MKIKDGQLYYLVHFDWFAHFCNYIGFCTETWTDEWIETWDQKNGIPEEISNLELINWKEKLLYLDEKGEKVKKFDGWLNINLKDNLKEDHDFVIVNPEVWRFLHDLFGGIAIKRYATIIDSQTEECIIEVYLQKLFVFDIPWEQK